MKAQVERRLQNRDTLTPSMKKNKGCALNAYPINSVINRYETRISKHKSFNILQQGGPAMPRKGAKGGGTIRQRPDGRWEARFTIRRSGPSSGSSACGPDRPGATWMIWFSPMKREPPTLSPPSTGDSRKLPPASAGRTQGRTTFGTRRLQWP